MRELPNSRGSRPFAWNSIPNDAARRVRSHRAISGRCMRLRFCLAVRAHAVLTHRFVSRAGNAGLPRSPLGQNPQPSKRYNIFREPSLRAPGRPASTWRRSAQPNRATFWNRALSREISSGSDACQHARPPPFSSGASKKSARVRCQGGSRRGAPRRAYLCPFCHPVISRSRPAHARSSILSPNKMRRATFLPIFSFFSMPPLPRKLQPRGGK